MKTCVVSVGVGSWFPEGVRRICDGLRKHGFEGNIVTWTDDWPPGSPPHSEAPYAFKSAALRIVRDAGYEIALYCDASMTVIRPIEPLMEHIAKHGSAIFSDGGTVGQYCTDAALPCLGLDREAAMKIPLIHAGILGLKFSDERSQRFVDQWSALALDGVTFHGPWTNTSGEASADPRVQGHRHDQTAASVLVHRLGIPLLRQPGLYCWAKDVAAPHTVIVGPGWFPGKE